MSRGAREAERDRKFVFIELGTSMPMMISLFGAEHEYLTWSIHMWSEMFALLVRRPFYLFHLPTKENLSKFSGAREKNIIMFQK